jgi:hypothetical protein
MSEITMKPVSLFLLMLLSLPTLAGQVIVNQGMSTADTFALRDQLAREHEWQEWLRFQQAIKWLEVLPLMLYPSLWLSPKWVRILSRLQ